MLKYLYIPENEDLDQHIDYAVNNNFHKIIHGESDIIKNLLIDKNLRQEINIPEHRQVLNYSLVFEENETFKLFILDEFNIDNRYESLKINLYRTDDNDLNEKKFVLSDEIKFIGNYLYEYELSLNNYGEYVFEIFFDFDEIKNILLTDKIIIYKAYIEESDPDDKFFFPG